MDWKIIVIVLVGLFLITSGFLEKVGVNTGDIESKAKDFLGKFVSNVPDIPVVRNITISGEFQNPEIDLSNIPIEHLTIKYEPFEQDHEIFISNNKMSVKSLAVINLKNYNGVLKINNDRLDIVGNSKEANINDISFETTTKNIPIEAYSLKFKELEINNLKINRFNPKNMNGKLSIQEKITINLENEPLILEAFLGDMKFSGTMLKIDGKTRRVLVSGKDYSATVGS